MSKAQFKFETDVAIVVGAFGILDPSGFSKCLHRTELCDASVNVGKSVLVCVCVFVFLLCWRGGIQGSGSFDGTGPTHPASYVGGC